MNLCGGSMGKLYEDRELFRARRAIYDAGFFKGVEEKASACLKGIFPEGGGVIVEAGCGEGSFLSYGRKIPKINISAWIYQRVQ